jgi:hypothetical protein
LAAGQLVTSEQGFVRDPWLSILFKNLVPHITYHQSQACARYSTYEVRIKQHQCTLDQGMQQRRHHGRGVLFKQQATNVPTKHCYQIQQQCFMDSAGYLSLSRGLASG